jgi:heme-degrading monooxygenase HmoA
MMHVQIVEFELRDTTEEQYRAMCDDLAPAFSGLPGLLAKLWLADNESGTYGGVYLWDSRQAMEGYKASDLFKAVGADPHLEGVRSREFATLEDPTRVTWGLGVSVPA